MGSGALNLYTAQLITNAYGSGNQKYLIGKNVYIYGDVQFQADPPATVGTGSSITVVPGATLELTGNLAGCDDNYDLLTVNNYGTVVLSTKTYTGTGCVDFYNYGNLTFGTDYSGTPNPNFQCYGGAFHLMPTSVLTVKIRAAPGSYLSAYTYADQFDFYNCPLCKYDGSLIIQFLNTYTPKAGDSFPIFVASNSGPGNPCYGSFSSIVATGLPNGLQLGVVYVAGTGSQYVTFTINVCASSNTTCTQTSGNTYTQPTNTIITLPPTTSSSSGKTSSGTASSSASSASGTASSSASGTTSGSSTTSKSSTSSGSSTTSKSGTSSSPSSSSSNSNPPSPSTSSGSSGSFLLVVSVFLLILIVI